MEALIARLEAEVVHLRADVRDMDARLHRFETKLDALKDAGREHSRGDVVVTDLPTFKVLQFVIYFVCTAAMFGGLAHGFGWI